MDREGKYAGRRTAALAGQGIQAELLSTIRLTSFTTTITRLSMKPAG